MIQGFKVPCPAFRRRRKNGREDSKPCSLRPPEQAILWFSGHLARVCDWLAQAMQDVSCSRLCSPDAVRNAHAAQS